MLSRPHDPAKSKRQGFPSVGDLTWAGTRVGHPKNAREGHEHAHCVRVKLAAEDERGVDKYIVDFGSAGEFLVRVLFAERLFAVEEYDSTGGCENRACWRYERRWRSI